MVVYGLDFGTTFSSISFLADGEVVALTQSNDTNIPTFLFLHQDDSSVSYGYDAEVELSRPSSKGGFFRDLKRWVGCDASNLAKYINDLKPHYSVTTTKLVGSAAEVPVIGNYAGDVSMSVELPMLIASFCRCLIQELEKYSSTTCSGVICSVPANYNSLQRLFTQSSVSLSGYECVRIINEPSAAVLVAAQTISADKSYLLVYDFGGGTFDVSAATYMNNTVCVRASGGDLMLGGRDVDNEILRWAFAKARKPINYKLDVSKLKEIVSSSSDLVVYPLTCTDGTEVSVEITNTDLENLARPYVLRTVKVLRDVFSSFCESEGLDVSTSKAKAILVGGSSSLPGVEKTLQSVDFLNGVIKLSNHRAAVCMGCSLNSECFGSNPKNLLVDCAVKNIGISAWNGEMITLVASGNPIPFSGSRDLIVRGATRSSNYTVTFFEGDYVKCAKNTRISSFSIALSALGVTSASPTSVPITAEVRVSALGTVECSLIGPGGVRADTSGSVAYDFKSVTVPRRAVSDSHSINFSRALGILTLTNSPVARTLILASEKNLLSSVDIGSTYKTFSSYSVERENVCRSLMGKLVPKLLRGGRLQKLSI